jgi:hypothetical protein
MKRQIAVQFEDIARRLAAFSKKLDELEIWFNVVRQVHEYSRAEAISLLEREFKRYGYSLKRTRQKSSDE